MERQVKKLYRNFGYSTDDLLVVQANSIEHAYAVMAEYKKGLHVRTWHNAKVVHISSDLDTELHWYINCSKYPISMRYNKWKGLNGSSKEVNKTLPHLHINKFMCAGWYFQKLAVLVPYPQMRFNTAGKLHHDTEPAILFPDGTGTYILNGVKVPKKIVTTPAHLLNPINIITANVEERKEVYKKIGVQRVLEYFKGKVIDAWSDYQLYKMYFEVDGGITGHYLKMVNPSTGEIHVEGVPTEIETVQGALSWRIGGISWNPIQLT